jgi:hypothetical protein
MSTANAVKAGEIAVEASVIGITESQGDLKRLAQELQRTGQKAQKSAGSIAKYTKIISGLVAARIVISSFNQINNMLAGTADRMDAIAKAADRMGISIRDSAQLGSIAELGGSSMKDIETGINAMNRQILQFKVGSAETVEIMENLGVTLQDIEGKGNVELFKMFADRISEFGSEADRAALRMKIFGKSGNNLINVIKGGAGGLEKMQRIMTDLGVGPADELVNDFVYFKDLLTTANKKFITIKDTLSKQLLPYVTEMLIAMMAFADTSSDSFDRLGAAMGRAFGQASGGAEDVSALIAVLDILATVAAQISNIFPMMRIAFNTVVTVVAKLTQGLTWLADRFLHVMFGVDHLAEGVQFLGILSEDAFNAMDRDWTAMKDNWNGMLDSVDGMNSRMATTEGRVGEIRSLFADMALELNNGRKAIQQQADAAGDMKDDTKETRKELEKIINMSKAFGGKAVVARGAAGIKASQDAQMAQLTKYLKQIANNTENAAVVQGL